MLKRLHMKKFTVFNDQIFEFSSGLNVIIGENSVGKTHVLKLAYALIACSNEAYRKPNASDPTKGSLQKAYAEKLIGVFRPEYLGRLVSRKQGRERCEVTLDFDQDSLNTTIKFASSAKTEVDVTHLPTAWQSQSPLYLPTRELLTIFPGFVSVYENHYLAYEETWRDTCVHLGGLALKGAREKNAAALLQPIEDALGGKVLLDANGHFYLSTPGKGNMEMPLLAEGYRKMAMLARLIANGTIQAQSYLFWDEPESNLNPRLIKLMAQVIHALCRSGVQMFIATHSLFLLRELEILQSGDQQFATRYFGLSKDPEGVQLLQGDHIDEIGAIAALEESLMQSDRYLVMGE